MIRNRTRPLIERLVPAAAGIGAALSTAIAAARKKDGGSAGNDRRGDRSEGQTTDRQATDAKSGGGDAGDQAGDVRARHLGVSDDAGGHTRLRQHAANGDGGNASADTHRGSVDTRQQTAPTPTTATTTTTTTITDAGTPTESHASIENANGDVIVGFDPATRSLVARSGNVTASVGPDGPKVIIDDEAVIPVTSSGDRPDRGSIDSSGGDNDMDMVS